MRPEPFDNEKLVMEAAQHLARASGMLNTLHLGPLDYNITLTVDYLLAAARCVQQFGRERASKNSVPVEPDAGGEFP
jgi:hypothetical protein